MLRLSLQRRRALMPWLLLGPGLAWLVIFFAIPLVNQLNVSLQTGDPETGYTFTWAFGTYADAVSQYDTQFLRSIGYAASATVLCFVIGFPLAYFIAFKAGRWKNLMLLLIVLPFFVSFVLRTVSWQLILADNGFVVDTLKSIGLVADDGRLLATRTAVIAGITYNFLPFMALPLYVSLEKIDRRLIEAATDLYASRWQAFWRVTFRLSLPGVVAGSLLTFIPAVGDFITAEVIGAGNPEVFMVGNIVQRRFLDALDYPTAAAISFVLVALVMLLVAAYTRVVGSERLTG